MFFIMEVPFYYSFKEFKENYENDLKKWLEVYTEGEEQDFLDILFNKYKNSIYSVEVEIQKQTELYPETLCIDIRKYFEIIENRLDAFIKYTGLNPQSAEDYKDIISFEIFNFVGVFDDKHPFYKTPPDDFILDYEEFYIKYKSFLEAYECGGLYYLYFNEIKFKNFQFAKKRVFEFIENRRKVLNTRLPTPPPDEVEPITLPENIKTTKVNTIRLLHYTGILEFLLKKYPRMNESNLASFFELITKTPIIHRNQNTHFYKNNDDSMYHKDDLDLILSKFNMIAENPKK